MTIHKEGIFSIVVAGLFLSVLLFLFFRYCPYSRKFPGVIMPVLVVMTSLCLFFLVVRFFRVPDRVINKVENGILSPADGTIVAIEEIFEDEYFKNKRLKISVFMSITNVHVNYFPIDGEVIYVCYHPGKHLVARYPKSSVYNEHQSVVVSKNEHETVLFRQIAGLIARRIAQQVKTGDIAVQGHEMGIIKFGSRVDVFLPLDCEPSVKIGDKVWAQKSVLAYF